LNKLEIELHEIVNISNIANDTAEVIWKMITLPDPMLLHLRATQILKTNREQYDKSIFEKKNNCKGSTNDEYVVEAYAYPVLINSCEGKIIEKGRVFVRILLYSTHI